MKKRNVFAPLTGVSSKSKHVSSAKHSGSERWLFGVLPADNDAPTVEDEKSKGRYMMVFAVAVLVFAGLLGRAFFLQVINGNTSLAEAQLNRFKQNVIRAPRGLFYDRNMTPLVKNVANYELTVVPSDLPATDKERQAVYARVAPIFGVTVADVKKVAESKEDKKHLSDSRPLMYPQPIVVSKTVSRDTSLIFDSKHADLNGFSVDINPIREYLDSGLLAHVFGYVGRINAEEYKEHKDYQITDYIGKMGLEKSYETNLRGVAGVERVERDSAGKVIKTYSQQDPTLGDNLQLSIDFELQKKLSQEISKQLALSKATRGTAIAVNPQNGEILAMVNLPTYDSNLFAKGISAADYKKLLESPDKPLMNKATSGEYPSGSIIKPFLAGAALQEKTINISTTVQSTGGIKVGTFEFPDWKAGGHGTTNVVKAIAESVNTFFYAIGGGYQNVKGMGPDVMKKYLTSFGFGKTVPLDIEGQAKGNIPDPDWKEAALGESWYLGDTYHMSIGQGDVLITPLQMANALQVIANGKNIYKLHFVKKVIAPSGVVKSEISPQIVSSDPISAENMDIIRQGMRACVTSGSCKILNTLPVPAAGKTGTAQFGPNNEHKHAWFTTFAPYDNPQIEMVILLDSAGEGSSFAAPVAYETLKWYFGGRK
jgi:penicillin-binding protein 2